MNEAKVQELMQLEKKYEAELARLEGRGMTAQAASTQASLDEVRAKLKECRENNGGDE
jgi:hypothetical protein